MILKVCVGFIIAFGLSFWFGSTRQTGYFFQTNNMLDVKRRKTHYRDWRLVSGSLFVLIFNNNFGVFLSTLSKFPRFIIGCFCWKKTNYATLIVLPYLSQPWTSVYCLHQWNVFCLLSLSSLDLDIEVDLMMVMKNNRGANIKFYSLFV